jgi:mannose-6-phosphate isomerase-like protein (cupin superfamily)
VEFKAIRRVVVGHDPEGKAVPVFDNSMAPTQRSPGGNAVANLWVTSESPIDPDGTIDKAETKVGVPPPAHSTIFRIVDFPPTTNAAAPSKVEHEKILIGMGIDPATQGYARHRNTHRTRSVDYAIVLDGEIDMLMDQTDVHLKAGDVLIQQGTNHAWVNNSGKVCRIAFVLIDAKAPAAWKQSYEP